jgi:uncharacterized OB-fold protein
MSGPEAGPDAQAQALLAQGVLPLQSCAPCGAVQYYPSIVCRSCGSPAGAFIAASGLGEIHASTQVAGDPGFNVALVDLDEGARLVTSIEANDAPIGTRVRARFQERDGAPFLTFEVVT